MECFNRWQSSVHLHFAQNSTEALLPSRGHAKSFNVNVLPLNRLVAWDVYDSVKKGLVEPRHNATRRHAVGGHQASRLRAHEHGESIQVGEIVAETEHNACKEEKKSKIILGMANKFSC